MFVLSPTFEMEVNPSLFQCIIVSLVWHKEIGERECGQDIPIDGKLYAIGHKPST